MREAASIVGPALGRPDLAYVQLPTAAFEPAFASMGLPKNTADLLIEMWNGANAGLIVPQQPRSAANITPTTLESFVSEIFAPAYRAETSHPSL